MFKFESVLVLLFLCFVSSFASFATQQKKEHCRGTECSGKCVNGYLNDSGQCTCFDIWQGANCTEHKCRNEGVPDPDWYNQTCKCHQEKSSLVSQYEGKYCERHRCNNHGRFFATGNGFYGCVCDHYYERTSNCKNCRWSYNKDQNGSCTNKYNNSNRSSSQFEFVPHSDETRKVSWPLLFIDYLWALLLWCLPFLIVCSCCAYRRYKARTEPESELVTPQSSVDLVPIRQPSGLGRYITNQASPPKYSIIATQEEPPPTYEQAIKLQSSKLQQLQYYLKLQQLHLQLKLQQKQYCNNNTI